MEKTVNTTHLKLKSPVMPVNGEVIWPGYTRLHRVEHERLLR